MWTKIKSFIILFFILGYPVSAAPDFLPMPVAIAEEDIAESANKEYFINLDLPTIAKGYTVTAFDDALKLSLVPGILREDTGVDVIELNEDLPMPWLLDLSSKVYQFEFRNKAAYDDHKPFYIQFAYEKSDDNYKQVFFYDKGFSAWRPLPTQDFPRENFVRSLIHLPFARIAVFSHPGVMTEGRASWYAYKNGNFAASPDFPKGSRLRVKAVNSDRYVDVVINDYGPDRYLHPDRAIDLDKLAFAALAPLGAGTIEIEIEPLYIAKGSNGNVLNIPSAGVGVEPVTTVRSAIIMNENSGKAYYSKDATTTLPLASLTKMVALKIFFETKPSLNSVVAYDKQDEEYNYEHVKAWESAKLNIDHGETLLIEDLVYASLVGSANNTVESLVRVSGLNRNTFIEQMNSTVKGWGAINTSFIEPSGLAPENVSSALDYAIITREVLKNPIIAKASTMPEYRFTTINKEVPHRIRNTNHLIKTNQYNFVGSKTGYLDEALYCLMATVKGPNAENIIVVTFGAETRDKSFAETEELIRYGLRELVE